MDIPVSLIEGVILLAVTGVGSWVWFVQEKLHKIELDLAKNYHPKDEIRRVVEDAILPVWKEMQRLAAALEKLGDDDR